jgi:hypothetical protein
VKTFDNFTSKRQRKTVQYAWFALKAVERVCLEKRENLFTFTQSNESGRKNLTRFAIFAITVVLVRVRNYQTTIGSKFVYTLVASFDQVDSYSSKAHRLPNLAE